MKWFSGSIDKAVATSQSRKAIFVVFVAGPDEASIEATKVIDTPEISSSLEKDDFVAIKLEIGSKSYRFFVRIYQFVPVPSLFFIGENGKPLEIMAGNITTSNLASTIDIVLSKAQENAMSDNLVKAKQSAAVASSSHSSTSNVAPSIKAPVENTIKLVENQSETNASQTHTENIKEDSSPKVIEAPSSSNTEVVQITSENNDKKNLTPVEKAEQSSAVASSSHSSTSNVALSIEAPVENTIKLVKNQSGTNASQTHTDKIRENSSPKVIEAPSSSNTEVVEITSENNDKKNLTPEKSVELTKKLNELQKQQKLETEPESEKLHEASRRSGSERIQKVLGRCIARVKNTVMMSRDTKSFDLRALLPMNYDLSDDARPGVLPPVILLSWSTKLPSDRGSDVGEIEEVETNKKSVELTKKLNELQKQQKLETELESEKLHEAPRRSGSERIQKVLGRCIARVKNTVMMSRDTKSFDSRTLLPTNYDLSDDARPGVLPPVIPSTSTTKLPSDRGSDVGEIEEVETIKKKIGFPESVQKFFSWNKCFNKKTLSSSEPRPEVQYNRNDSNKILEYKLKENACEEACITCIYYTQQMCECVIV